MRTPHDGAVRMFFPELDDRICTQTKEPDRTAQPMVQFFGHRSSTGAVIVALTPVIMLAVMLLVMLAVMLRQ